MSTNTRSDPKNIGPFNKGRCIFLVTSSQLEPKLFAASSMLGDILSNPESRVPFDIVKNRTIYPQIRRHIAIKWNLELEIVINDIANTVPGIAYPIPAGTVSYTHLTLPTTPYV